jgi:hypothetical protein
MATLVTTFVYRPLEEDEIRLISIKPETLGGPLHCELVHAALKDALEYVVLSYVWGDPAQRVPIRVNGHEIYVTRNLFDFLHLIRDLATDGRFDPPSGSGEPIRFWADGICINQMDMDEKNKQVPRMGQIYASALRVLGFLGLPEDIDEESRNLFFNHANKFSAIEQQDPSSQAFKAYPLAQALGDDFEPFLLTFSKIIQRPWFQRVWILQEAALPKAPLLCLLGKRMVTVDTFGKLWSNFSAMKEFTDPELVKLLRMTTNTGPTRILLVRLMYETFPFQRDMSGLVNWNCLRKGFLIC